MRTPMEQSMMARIMARTVPGAMIDPMAAMAAMAEPMPCEQPAGPDSLPDRAAESAVVAPDADALADAREDAGSDAREDAGKDAAPAPASRRADEAVQPIQPAQAAQPVKAAQPVQPIQPHGPAGNTPNSVPPGHGTTQPGTMQPGRTRPATCPATLPARRPSWMRPGLLRDAWEWAQRMASAEAAAPAQPAQPAKSAEPAEPGREEPAAWAADPSGVVTDARGIPWPASLMQLKKDLDARLQVRRQQDRTGTGTGTGTGAAPCGSWQASGTVLLSEQDERLAVFENPEDARFAAQLCNVLPLVLTLYERLSAACMDSNRENRETQRKLAALRKDWSSMKRVLVAQNALVRTYNEACLQLCAREDARPRVQADDRPLLDWLVNHLACESVQPVCPYACGHFDQTKPCPLWKPEGAGDSCAAPATTDKVGTTDATDSLDTADTTAGTPEEAAGLARSLPDVATWKKLVFPASDDRATCRCNVWQCWKQACLWACGRSAFRSERSARTDRTGEDRAQAAEAGRDAACAVAEEGSAEVSGEGAGDEADEEAGPGAGSDTGEDAGERSLRRP